MDTHSVNRSASIRRGDWQQTFTGRQFWPCDPRAEDVALDDIAHALSLQCRFAGHCRAFYSVAEHSVRVSRVVWLSAYDAGMTGAQTTLLALAGLLHDASEAYCIDVPRPLKPFLQGYREIERGVAAAIAERFGFAAHVFDHPLIKRADEVLLMTEKRDLLGPSPAPWTFAQGVDATPLDERIAPWAPADAEMEFHARFRLLAPKVPRG